MNPTRSTNVWRYEESRSARNEDHDVHSILLSRTEEKKQRRRREWQRQQERERLDGSTSGSLPLFKGPEGIQISTTELCRIKVDIHRNILTKGPIVTELQRSILNAEDVVLKRRDGEGTKPIFDREEIKKAVTKTNEIEERRTVVAVDGEQSGTKQAENVIQT
ncbi:uncharacterized protein LOC114931712 isoform X2 [Nylanderia fulva]|uniref:uncharacterized protein LOC114931712 isoform X2 n=1 Tax=Nylanderia fulva TaxID=613905 RepID=UPI0010FBA9C7|nr:uncharacterized protein LOC114931712 isoform X2 [Nylanderia fulva]